MEFDDRRTMVRCQKNPYKTILFSYNRLGIWVRCKDCRVTNRATGEVKRGDYHLFTWIDLLKMAMGFYKEVESGVTARRDTSGDHKSDEIPAPTSVGGPGGDTGG